MDSLINAAARALAGGDPVAALKHVGLREDPAALALRGIAMAQLADYPRARELLRRAARSFGAREALSRARCVLAEAEVALASRDLAWPGRALASARASLEDHGDTVNAAHAGLLQLRHLLLVGRLDEVEAQLARMDAQAWPPALRAVHELVAAAVAMRRVRAQDAALALERAMRFAQASRVMALTQEVEAMAANLGQPAARRVENGVAHAVTLAEVEKLLASKALVVDACSHAVRLREASVSLARRPVPFALARVLAEAWPGDVDRNALIARVFRTRRPDDSHRARLRVEIARLRRLLAGFAEVIATERGFALLSPCPVVVLAPPEEGAHASVLALLADGEAWSSSALALALDASQRTVQRALDELAATGRVQPVGHGRARRWIAPALAGFATPLLLPGPVPGG